MLYAFAIPFVWIADVSKQKNGLHLVVSGVERIPVGSVDPTIKNYHWLDLTRGLYDTYDRGGETVVLTDGDGHVVEGPGFNIFIVSGGRLATPDHGVLEGITRRTAIEITTIDLKLVVEQKPVPASQLRDAHEVFVTSTAGGIMPAHDDRRPAGRQRHARPGHLRIKDRSWALHDDPRFRTPISYD